MWETAGSTAIYKEAMILLLGLPCKNRFHSLHIAQSHLGGWNSPFLGVGQKGSLEIKYWDEIHGMYSPTSWKLSFGRIHLGPSNGIRSVTRKQEEIPHPEICYRRLGSPHEWPRPGASWRGLRFRTGWSSMNSAGCWMWSTFCWNPGVQSKSSAEVPRNTWGKEAVSVSTAASMVVALLTFSFLWTNSTTFRTELRFYFHFPKRRGKAPLVAAKQLTCGKEIFLEDAKLGTGAVTSIKPKLKK